MSRPSKPAIRPIKILDLRPLQLTVGFREVAEKRARWREEHGKKAARYLGNHMVPVLIGPAGRHYILDSHHTCRALHDEGVEVVLPDVVHDLSKLEPTLFWQVVDMRNLAHLFGAEGQRVGYKELPKTVAGLVDDPFRSLAGRLRRAGGFAKDTSLFSEFQWGGFLRQHIKRKLIEEDFDKALEAAMTLAKSPAAAWLAGWCGPH